MLDLGRLNLRTLSLESLKIKSNVGQFSATNLFPAIILIIEHNDKLLVD